MKVLFTGGTGLLGKAMRETRPPSHTLLSLHRTPSPMSAHAATEWLGDVRKRDELRKVVDVQAFDVVIHAAGLSSVDYVERHEEEAVESNLTGTANVVELCNDSGKHLIYVSTNAVFDGSHAPYGEEDSACPVNAYGRIKLRCEELVAKEARAYSIVRPILMYGWNYSFARSNPVTWLLDKVGRGESVSIVTDVHENPLFFLQAGEALWKMIERPDIRLVHIAGGKTVSRYEFALAVARIFGLDADLIRPVGSNFFPNLAPRPRNTSFRTDRMEKELKVVPVTIEDGLRAMAASRRAGPTA